MISRLFTIMAIVSVAGFAVTYWAGHLILVRTTELEAIEHHIDVLSDTISTMKDAETGGRGYLLTDDESYLAPYQSARERIQRDLAELVSFAPHERGELKDLIERKLDILDRTINLVRSNQRDAALAIMRTGAGKNYMDALREKIAGYVAREETAARAARQFVTQGTWLRTGIFAGVALVTLLFLGWAHNRVVREVARRMQADAEARREKDLLAVTLRSIGDAVMLTDTGGRIMYMNAMAEQLTGWPLSEAVGRSCAEVFRIVNEYTRGHVESPVDKVLAHGGIVGLANHTLLVARDGHEVPIDDSGAPVKEPDGTLRGVVLVFRDFSAQKEYERTLRKAKEELEAAGRAKDMFLAMLSHELRTPLTPVLATLSSWERNANLPPQIATDLAMMRRNVDLEARLIDDLLDVTRIARGKLALSPEVCDLHELIRSVVNLHAAEIEGKGLTATVQAQAQRHFVMVDPARMQQVFWNLLTNAVKFTPVGGRITLSTANDSSGRIAVRIQDTGIGMEADLLKRLFKPFEQGTSDQGQRVGGLGLGLSIAKALVEAHGGQLSASSPGTNQGSTFELVLLSTDARPARPPKVAPAAATVATGWRVLVIEDHADSATVIARILVELGHTPSICDSVAAARQMVDAERFDLIISDIGLPDGTGVDLIRHVRQARDWPAIALSGYGMEEDVRRSLAAGFNAHLTKPVTFESIEAVLREVARSEAREVSAS